MTFTEHSIALVAIIIGLGLANMLSDIHGLIRAGGKVQWSAVPIVWAAFAFLGVINYWWALYFRGLAVTTASSAGAFLLGIIQPMILYLICANVLPGAVPDSGTDLREKYFAQCRYFLGLILVYLALSHLTAGIASNWEWNSGSTLRTAVFLVIVPLLWTRKYWHHLLVAGISVALLLWRLFLQARL